MVANKFKLNLFTVLLNPNYSFITFPAGKSAGSDVSISSRVNEINIEKRLNERIGELPTIGDSAFDQKPVELATLAQNLSAPVTRLTLRYEISGKAIKVGTERAASEINERALFFVQYSSIKMIRVFG